MREFVNKLVALGPLGVFALAAIDSAGIPIPGGVDALLLLIAVVSPDRAWLSAAAAVAGSMAGNFILFFALRKLGQTYLDEQTHSGKGLRLRRLFERYGMITVFIPALLIIPMPLKIPVACMAILDGRLPRFLLIIFLARIPRYAFLAWLGLQLGHGAGAWIRAHVWHFAGFALLLMLLLFGTVHFLNRRAAVD